MDSKREFKDELESDTFPKDLDQAYDRIAQRILQNNRPSRDTSVKRILGWIVCAARPLRWREIQSRFCIDAEKQICDIENARLDSCKAICSSFVDVTECDLFPNIESEQVVSMVHETATKYLVRNGTVNLLQEHIDMTLFCCRYLSSRSFTMSRSQNITDEIRSGYFSFLDYAAAHYALHIEKVEALTDSALTLEAVKQAAADLAKANCRQTSVQTEESDETTQDWNLAIQDNVLVVRSLIGLQRKKPETAIFDATEGPIRHKCHRIQCSKFATGYSSEAALNEHLAVHDRPFRCPHSDCFANTIGYASQRRLESHNEAFHHTTTGAKATFPTGSKTGEWDLYEACKAGDLDEVKRFHRGGEDLKGAGAKIVTPLCAAAEAGHGHVCKYLVDNGIDPFRYKRDARSSRNPITGVINGSHLEILEFFLHSGNGPSDSELAEYIARAIYVDRPAALNMFLTIRQPIDHADVIKLVPGEIISQTVRRLARRDSHSIDATLIHAWFQYVKPEFYNEKGLFIAQSDCAEYKIWGDIIFRQLNSFHTALREGCYSLATFLMDIGNDEYLQIKTEHGDTPLHCCIRGLCRVDCSSCMSMVRRLLQYDGGKSANITDSHGSLPAHIVMNCTKSQAVLRAVLDNTGDINHRDNSGQSPLHKAKSAQLIRVLLENKSVDLFSRNNRGQTAFSALSSGGYFVDVDAFEYLFEADPRLAWAPDESKEGFTPLHHTMELLERQILDYYMRERIQTVAKFLLTCSGAKRVLMAYKARSTNADRRKVREFARREMLQEALDIMDLILFGVV
ncbi:putative ankyrin repeat protein [Fusarium oxysporum f. sp. cubense]|uniref:Putative ankyrin repeat protein n=1 Tax=Fusarium oxysporum f. sp. cubense TaxID=61366 RepID=A0A559KWC6_FUSOC|nr:putative ankyrin repeat protein [Fusarium oxysporum f. sp. cubense]